MKVFGTIMKIVAAVAAVAGVVYLLATYGDKLVAWAKKTLCLCSCDDCCCGDDCCCEEGEECCCEAEEAPAVEAADAASEADFED